MWGFWLICSSAQIEKSESKVAQSCPTLFDLMDCSLPGSSVHGIFPGKNTGVDCHFLLQEIFPTQGLNPDIPHCRQTLYRLSHQGSPTRVEEPWWAFWLVVYRLWGKVCSSEWRRCLARRSAWGSLRLHPTPVCEWMALWFVPLPSFIFLFLSLASSYPGPLLCSLSVVQAWSLVARILTGHDIQFKSIVVENVLCSVFWI